MKSAFLGIMVLILLTACASMDASKKGMVEDLGSPEKGALLKDRATDFWSAFVREDYERIYYLYDPFFQSRTNKYAFIGTLGKIRYHSFEIKDVVVEGNIGRVNLNIVYSVPKTRLKALEFSQPETPAELEEIWLYIYDNWYKEYKIQGEDKGLIEY